MRAAVCPVYGPPDVVRIEDQPSAAVAAGQVRVKVGAAAVNFPDVLLIANEYQISVPPPFVPGSEFAGAIGAASRTAYHTLRSMARVQEGDEVIVLGAGGGVGLAAVQLGVQLGASVTAVASSAEKLDVAAG